MAQANISSAPSPRPRVVTFGADEWIADIALAALPATNVTLPTQGGQIPNMRFLKSLVLWWEGRITNAASNNPSGFQQDGFPGLIDTIKIQGTHRVRGKQEQFINVRGPDMREWCGIYQGKYNRISLIPANTENFYRLGVICVSLWFSNISRWHFPC